MMEDVIRQSSKDIGVMYVNGVLRKLIAELLTDATDC